MSQPLHRLATKRFDERYKRKQSESLLSQPEHTIWVLRQKTLTTQYIHSSIFLWKQYITLASYKLFWKLRSFCLCTPLLIISLFWHLLTEIVNFTNVGYQRKCFNVDSFSFFRSRFCKYSTYLFDFIWSSNKIFKDNKIFLTVHWRPFIRYQRKNLDLF